MRPSLHTVLPNKHSTPQGIHRLVVFLYLIISMLRAWGERGRVASYLWLWRKAEMRSVCSSYISMAYLIPMLTFQFHPPLWISIDSYNMIYSCIGHAFCLGVIKRSKMNHR